jgi:phospholipid transport system substrate-binding protein
VNSVFFAKRHAAAQFAVESRPYDTGPLTLLAAVTALMGLLLAGFAGQAGAADQATPNAVVESTATALARKLEGRQGYFAAHPAELHSLVDKLLLPGFDVTYASKLVLGREHWTAATDEQRDRFAVAFYGFLVRTYAKGLLSFDQKAMTVDAQPRFSKKGNKALVRTQLALIGGNAVEINYALRKTGEIWKMYDVRIDGVSYIQNYRSQFDAEISARGMQAVIERLERETVAAGGSVTSG